MRALLASLFCMKFATLSFAVGTWEEVGLRGIGKQFDMQRGINMDFHVIEANYYHLDKEGNLLDRVDNFEGGIAGDRMSFPPSLDIDNEGGVHTVVRTSGGWDGFTLEYAHRNPDGTWDERVSLGEPKRRNYHVGVAALDDGSVHMAHSISKDIVWKKLVNGEAIETQTWSNVTHAEGTFLVRSNGKRTVVTYAPKRKNLTMKIFDGSSLPEEEYLEFSYPNALLNDIYMHDDNGFEFVYGEHRSVLYQRFKPEGVPDSVTGKIVLDDLGAYNFESGHGVVASTDDRANVMIVAQNGYQTGGNDLKLVWTLSTDSGKTFSQKQVIDTPDQMVSGGERLMPRLICVGKTFFLMYPSNQRGGLFLYRYDLEDPNTNLINFSSPPNATKSNLLKVGPAFKGLELWIDPIGRRYSN